MTTEQPNQSSTKLLPAGSGDEVPKPAAGKDKEQLPDGYVPL